MIHMDIDFHPSPASGYRSFRQVSMSSMKRARSPDADAISYDEHRPSKRLFVTTSGFRLGATDYAERSPGSSLGAPSANNSRHPSEDWVKQAGGLSIESPMLHGSRSTNSSYERLPICGDVDVSMDMEESPSEIKAAQVLSSSSSSSYPTAAQPLQVENTPMRGTSGVFARLRPEINVVPATPGLARAHSLLNDADTQVTSSPMSLSPQQSFNQLLSPQSSRRPKFTMGPRADCEKCRLGVKGHWMHLD